MLGSKFWLVKLSYVACSLGMLGLTASAQDQAPQSGVKVEDVTPAKQIAELPLIFEDHFEATAKALWEPSDPHAWKIVPRALGEKKDNHVYTLFQQSQVKTPVRSPFNRSIVKDLIVSDVVLDVTLQSTGRDYGHRDLCLFFGYQDPAHMYYVHLGKKADPHANQIFIVNNAPRLKISTETTEGTNWDDNWHHARLTRNVATGTIDVYFDDMKKPVMRAVDKTFTWGQVGIGSFDDTGNFDDVLVHGTVVDRPKVEQPAKK